MREFLKRSIKFFNEYTSGVPFVLWSLGGMAIALFVYSARNESFVNFEKLKYIIVVAAFWFIASDIIKRRRLIKNSHLHFIADSAFYLFLYSSLIYFTDGFDGDIFFLSIFTLISAPFFATTIELIIFVTLIYSATFVVYFVFDPQDVTPYHTAVLALQAIFGFIIAALIKYFLEKEKILEHEKAAYAEDLAKKRTEELRMSMADLERREKELSVQMQEISQRNLELENTKKAVLNILQDTKELEDSLRKERDQSHTILSSMGEGLMVIDSNFKVMIINKVALELLQLRDFDALGKDSRRIIEMYKGNVLIADEERPVTKMFRMGEKISVKLEDDYYYKTMGRKFPIALVTVPMKNEAGQITGAIVVFHDITDEKSLGRAKDDFISIASHQLRTPLTAIRWYSEMLESQTKGKLTPEQDDFVQKILSGALRLNNIIRLFLTMARIESGSGEFEMNKFDLIKTAQEVIKDIEPIAKQNDVTIKIESGMGGDDEIYFDQTMVKQVLSNLISNSVWYSGQKDKLILVSAGRTPTEIIVSVKDNGIGIPPEDHEKIFNKFFRSQNARTKRPEGSGLGLSFVRSIVEGWKGRIWFESPAVWKKDGKEERVGTVFYFIIPLVKPPAEDQDHK
jgi:PAS domain S-box-containing protein